MRFIQAPENSQSFNPYSYIMNNPLAGVDPSGYVSEGTSVTVVPPPGPELFTIVVGSEEQKKAIDNLCKKGCTLFKHDDGTITLQASNGSNSQQGGTKYISASPPGGVSVSGANIVPSTNLKSTAAREITDEEWKVFTHTELNREELKNDIEVAGDIAKKVIATIRSSIESGTIDPRILKIYSSIDNEGLASLEKLFAGIAKGRFIGLSSYIKADKSRCGDANACVSVNGYTGEEVIRLSPAYFSKDRQGRAITLIHEWSHMLKLNRDLKTLDHRNHYGELINLEADVIRLGKNNISTAINHSYSVGYLASAFKE